MRLPALHATADARWPLARRGAASGAARVACVIALSVVLSNPSRATVPPVKPDRVEATPAGDRETGSARSRVKLGGPGAKMTADQFLDRVMMIESGGRDDARNRRSTATGPYQFLASTFLYIMRRSYPGLVAGKTRRQILAMRTNRTIARRAALALTRHNAAILVARGHDASFANLRLAHLLGAGGASRVLAAKPNVRVARLLGRHVIRANPFMARLTAKQLVARAAREIAPDRVAVANVAQAGGAATTVGDATRGNRVMALAVASVVRTAAEPAAKRLAHQIASKAASATEHNRRLADAKVAAEPNTAAASNTNKPATSTAAVIKRAVSTEVIGKPQRAPLPVQRPKVGGPSDTITFDQFLDRLMIAESGGRDDARNPLSTATGPFQFIESTFLDVMRRHFPKVAEGKSRDEILALRTNRKIARDAARAFTEDNAAILAADGHTPTFPNLRLAFLLGAGGASRVLAMEPDARVAPVLGRTVIRANPFMARLTAGQLVARAARDISVDAATLAGLKGDPSRLKRKKPAGPRIVVRCNLRLPSCKRWLALKKRRIRRGLDAKAKRLARQRRASNR